VFQFRPAKEPSSIPRRALLMGGFAGAVGCTFAGVVNAATAIVLPTAGGSRRFSVLYKGFTIGAHTVSYSPATGEMRVDTDIDLSVKVAFLSVFAFRHRSQETWRAGRLMSLNSETVEHGEDPPRRGRGDAAGISCDEQRRSRYRIRRHLDVK
jgi:hypothetical protein